MSETCLEGAVQLEYVIVTIKIKNNFNDQDVMIIKFLDFGRLGHTIFI